LLVPPNIVLKMEGPVSFSLRPFPIVKCRLPSAGDRFSVLTGLGFSFSLGTGRRGAMEGDTCTAIFGMMNFGELDTSATKS
jgi:hypothetical protein